jgi:predicted RNA-binding protein with PIN domain
MDYVIDGYNLLHAMGGLKTREGPSGLEKARERLLGILKGSFGEEATLLTVMFDASHARAHGPAQTSYHGVRIRFARTEEADDLIETLIEQHHAPKQLTVVSDDHRLRRAARRRRACSMSCGAFIRLLVDRRKSTAPLPEKIELSPEESQQMLEAFRHLDDELRRELDPFGFDELEG